MTNFIKSKIYTLERKQIDVFTDEYEYSIAVHDGYRFYVLDDETGELVLLGLFKVHDKLFAIVDMQTGLVVNTSHYRSDSKESAVEHFKKNYKAQFLKARHNDRFYSLQKMVFEGVKSK